MWTYTGIGHVQWKEHLELPLSELNTTFVLEAVEAHCLSVSPQQLAALCSRMVRE